MLLTYVFQKHTTPEAKEAIVSKLRERLMTTVIRLSSDDQAIQLMVSAGYGPDDILLLGAVLGALELREAISVQADPS